MKVVINYQEYSDVEVEKKILSQLKDVEILESRTINPLEFINEVRDADGVIIQYVPCNKEVISEMKKAKVIVRYGIAVDTIDLQSAKQKGIKVCNVPTYCLDEVSNHTISMILALHRRLFIGDRLLREDKHHLEKLRPIPRLAETRLGLVGFGNISRLVAKKARNFFLEILAYDPFVNKEEMERLGVVKTELIPLFKKSDFISIHIPLTKETKHLINRELIQEMKNSAFLINTSRGKVVDEQALIEALQLKKIAGAGLDVFEVEPFPADNPLRSLDNVILTNHYAWYSEGAIKELKESAAMEVLRVLRGEKPLHEVKI